MERQNAEELCEREGIEIKTKAELDPLEHVGCTQIEEGNIVSKYVEEQIGGNPTVNIVDELNPNSSGVDLLNKEHQELKELNHKVVLSGDKPIRCNCCNAIFVNKQELAKHEINKKFKCDQCNKWVKTRQVLMEHKRHHRGKKPYRCDKCSAAFARKRTCLVHQKKHHFKRFAFECDECHKDFPLKKELHDHKRTHTGENPFKCDQCGKAFKSKGQLSRHKNTHIMKFQCGLCNSMLATRANLTRHNQLIHEGKKPYQCDQCSAAFTHNEPRLEHQKKHHFKRFAFECDVCHKDFALKYKLNAHKRTHISGNPYACDQCNEKFSKISSLLGHKRVHVNEKTSTKYRYELERHNEEELCVLDPIEIKTDIELHPLEHVEYTQDGKGNIVSKYVEGQIKYTIEEVFSYKKELCVMEGIEIKTEVELDPLELGEYTQNEEENLLSKYVERQIKGEPIKIVEIIEGPHSSSTVTESPFNSGECSETFNKNSLKLDNRTKRLVGSLQCDECDKMFKTKITLRQHKQLHTGEDPVQCDKCNRKFKRKRYLAKHKRCHIKDPVQCDECDKVFEKKSLLIAHKVIHINGKPYLCDQCSESFSWAYELVVHKSFHAEPIEL